MKIEQHIIVATLLSVFSVNAFSNTTNIPSNSDYITITGYLGTRFSEDVKHLDTEATATFSSALTQAIALGWNYERNSEGELLFSNSKQRLSLSDNSLPGLDVYVQYLHFGGKILFKDDTPFSTSIGLGVGGTYFNPSDSEYDDDIAFSANISGGLRYQINQQFAFRGDLRVYGTLLDSDSELFCGNSHCYLSVDGNIYVQAELMAGLEYKF